MAHLEGLPGRKNVLWFSGVSRLYLRADASVLPIGENLQPIYDELNTNRIALYPIDARGLTIGASMGNTMQHMQMREMAAATGGLAFFNTNDLGKVAGRVLATDRDFYTLTYAPHEVKLDNRWHKVRVHVDGPYTLSYRQGYFDDGSTLKTTDHTKARQLLAGGRTVEQNANGSDPIVFSVALRPYVPGELSRVELPGNMAPPSEVPKGSRLYLVHYKLPVASFALVTKDGALTATVNTMLLVMNSFGEPTKHTAWSVTIKLDPEKVAAHPDGVLGFDEPVPLPKGTAHLALAVWDPATRRMGRLEMPVEVPKQPKAAQ